MLNLVILGGFCKSTASLTPKFYYVISVSIVSFPRSFKVQERYVDMLLTLTSLPSGLAY